ncbi:MAG: hypothetical protein MUF31_17325 [Akkermansiaceae bacterium]|jgi:hypothetical protein|nr:hypothetical protein [Akkermansiaceae bacterium]
MAAPLRSLIANSKADFCKIDRQQNAPSVLMKDWLSASGSGSGPISSNQPAIQLPFQRWFKFKEAFSPQFIVDCAKSFKRKPRTCLDPFGGSGTSALTAQFLGIKPTTIEVNPFLADLIEAKLTTYDLESLKQDFFQVIERRTEALASEAFPATFIEPGVNDRWIFSRSTAKRILEIRNNISSIDSKTNRTLLNVILGSTLVPNSNIVVNGKGRRYRRNWKTQEKTPNQIELTFRRAFHNAFADICHYGERPEKSFELHRGDSRQILKSLDSVDFAVLSPPYPNSFDYTDIYNVELWMLGYLKSQDGNRALREETLRSHVQIKRDFSNDTLNSKTLKKTYRKIKALRSELWSSYIPEMICAYFVDMREILDGIKAHLNKGGKAFLAVGNSQYAGVEVDTETILKELSLDLGFRTASSKPIRSMRASAQQGGREQLTESLVILGK